MYASSVGAYSPGRDDEPVDESWPTHALPTAAYGREKSYVERVLDVFELEHPDMRVVRLRPGFIFKRESASAQRRLFAGPLLPNRLVRPELIPAVPDLPGLRFQALHALDAAEAYRLAIVRQARGAFNLAAEPLVDPQALAELFDARAVRLPRLAVRTALAAAWHRHFVPASPTLFDLALSLSVMDTGRARSELGWTPARSSLDALGEFLVGPRGSRSGHPPLRSRTGGRLRRREFPTGVGSDRG